MKILLFTTQIEIEENQRLKEEALRLNHQIELVDFKDFSYIVGDKNPFFLDIVKQKPDLIIFRATFQSLKILSALAEYLRKKGILVFDNHLLEHKYSIDKSVDILKLAFNNIPIPKTGYSRSFSDYPKVAKKFSYPVIFKPCRTGKGIRIEKIENEDDLISTLEREESEGRDAKDFIIQEFIPYKHDLRVLVLGNKIFCMERIPRKGDFRANFSLGGSVKLFDLSENDKNLALKAARSLNLTFAGVDLLIIEDKTYVLEVNHTPGFIGMEKATGQNLGKIWIEQAIKKAY